MSVAIVIPIYKEELSEFEKISLMQVRKVLSKYPIIFIGPQSKSFVYLNNDDVIIRFNDSYFQNIQNYNQLMMSSLFYETFLNFDYILIYQLDAFVFYDALEDFCKLNYDYIGAPWPRMWIFPFDNIYVRVGNGGFSLRKVKSCYQLVQTKVNEIQWYLANNISEDVFFAHCSILNNFKIAPINIAHKFSMEFHPRRSIKKNNNMLPFGCHAWHVYDPQFYSQLLSEFGYNIIAGIIDKDKCVINWLIDIAEQRVLNKIKNNQSIIQYLSHKQFHQIYIIRNTINLRILNQLLIDNINITNNIHIIDDIIGITINEFTLIITFDNDVNIIQYLVNKNYIYGKNFISFRQEYLRYYQNIFNNLGK